MKIPKKIQNIIDRRERLAMELLDVCEKLDSWLEKNGADLTDSDIADSTISGCMIYCEPEKCKNCCGRIYQELHVKLEFSGGKYEKYSI